MALRKPSLESARCSAGELTLGELGSLVCDKDDRPRVNMLKLGRAAMIAGDVVSWLPWYVSCARVRGTERVQETQRRQPSSNGMPSQVSRWRGRPQAGRQSTSGVLDEGERGGFNCRACLLDRGKAVGKRGKEGGKGSWTGCRQYLSLVSHRQQGAASTCYDDM